MVHSTHAQSINKQQKKKLSCKKNIISATISSELIILIQSIDTYINIY